jgi:hypothetical protein
MTPFRPLEMLNERRDVRKEINYCSNLVSLYERPVNYIA